MRSFRVRTTVWITLGFFGLMFVALVALNINAVHAVAHNAKKRMKTVSRSILRELRDCGVTGPPVPAWVSKRINDKLAFMDDHGHLAYAVVSKQHELLYNTPDFNIPLDDEKLLSKQRKRLFLYRITAGSSRLEDALSEWHFLFRYEKDNFIVFVSDEQDYELIERFAQGLGVAFLLACGLSIPLGVFLSSKALGPMQAINTATRQIRDGDLSARVSWTRSGDEVKELVESLNETFSELEVSIERISQFSADAAHELNTPLTAIRGNIEVCLAKDRAPEEYQRVLVECLEEVTGLSSIVRDLLLLSRPGRDKHRAAFMSFDAVAVASEVVEHLSDRAARAQLEIAEEMPDALEMCGHETMFGRLCWNLIDNGVKYSDPGGQVRISLQQDGANVVLRVTNKGKSITEADVARIFTPFVQLDSSRTEGHGLGLALAKWIVDLHGGTLSVASDEDGVTTFQAVLPDGIDNDACCPHRNV